jgi:hypothetical protein
MSPFEHLNRCAVVALMVAVLPLAACGGTSEKSAGGDEPAKVEAVEGTELSRVILTTKAAERLGVRTDPVRDGPGAGPQLTVVPYSALVYGANGATWVYTNPQRLVFVRAPVAVERIDGKDAFLSDGPVPGTGVVTVGVAELYGTELGIE